MAEHWGKLLLVLLGFYGLVARLTPTTKDNSIVTFLTNVFNAVISNLKKGGKYFREKDYARLPRIIIPRQEGDYKTYG